MASNLLAMANSDGLQLNSDGLNIDGLQPHTDGLELNSDGLNSDGLQRIALASN